MRLVILAFLFMADLLPAAWGQPAQIILLRHAEKPADTNQVHLSLSGRERAMALVPFLTETPEFLTNGLPVALYATRLTAHNHGHRAQETIEPLAQKLGLALRVDFASKNYEGLARAILADESLRGKTVVICWVHESIPDLAAALGVRRRVRKLGDEVYDRVFLITAPGPGASVQNLPQRLMKGDSDR